MSEPGTDVGHEAAAAVIGETREVLPQRSGAEPVPRTSSWLSLALPAGWVWKESITLVAPDGMANVIASTEPLDVDTTLEVYVDAQTALLQREFPEFHQYRLEPFLLPGGIDARLREFAWTPPEGERVRQVQLYAVREGRGITATATTPESTLGVHRDRLVEAVASLVIDPS
jgi:hypothetical protein